jgi:hypothetical protein
MALAWPSVLQAGPSQRVVLHASLPDQNVSCTNSSMASALFIQRLVVLTPRLIIARMAFSNSPVLPLEVFAVRVFVQLSKKVELLGPRIEVIL